MEDRYPGFEFRVILRDGAAVVVTVLVLEADRPEIQDLRADLPIDMRDEDVGWLEIAVNQVREVQRMHAV